MIAAYLSDAKLMAWDITFSTPSLSEGVESEDEFEPEEDGFCCIPAAI
jgi:hypothetical protein